MSEPSSRSHETVNEKLQWEELDLVRTVLENDLEIAQRDDLIAAVGDGKIMMMGFDEVWASDDFEDIAILASERWCRPITELEAYSATGGGWDE